MNSTDIHLKSLLQWRYTNMIFSNIIQKLQCTTEYSSMHLTACAGAGTVDQLPAWWRGRWCPDLQRPAGHPPRPGRGRGRPWCGRSPRGSAWSPGSGWSGGPWSCSQLSLLGGLLSVSPGEGTVRTHNKKFNSWCNSTVCRSKITFKIKEKIENIDFKSTKFTL